jgi:hypothetical protein
MFAKFASTTLQELADKCLLKSFACENKDDAKMYKVISDKANYISAKLEVETLLKKAFVRNV